MLPLLLISNDDGIRAPGIEALVTALADIGDVLVVAPDRERSATSHAITLDRPLCATEIAANRFAIDGTPADCVYLGVRHIAPRKPDLVVSGINSDVNLGSDLFYSGTVAAALEGAIHGVPSIAISLERGPASGYATAGAIAHALARAILAQGLPPKAMLNVNVPNRGPVAGYQWTRLGERVDSDELQVIDGSKGRRFYFSTGGGPRSVPEQPPGADTTAVLHGLISITPLELDLTSHGLLGKLPGWHLPGFEAMLAEEGAAKR